MNQMRRLFGATLMVPVLLAVSNPARSADDPVATPVPATFFQQTYPPSPDKLSPRNGAKGSNQAATSPYRSQGPSILTNIPKPQSSGGLPVLATGQNNPSPYRSEGSLTRATLPKTMPVSQGSDQIPTINQVVTPYQNAGTLGVPAVGSPQTSGYQPGGATFPGSGGTMNAPSPYESTATPGTSSPFAIPPTGANAGQGASPSQIFGAGNGGGGAADASAGSGGALSSGLGGFGSGAPSAFAMIGDASPLIGRVSASGQNPPPPGSRSIIAPSVRGFKIAENQSPVPQDRFFFSFNYYNNVNKTLDNFFQVQLKGVEIYRYVFGYEKTFNQGMGSVGIRLPIDNVFAQPKSPGVPGEAGTSTATGDLTVYLKHIFAIDRATGSVASGGVAISPQTAPGQFGGAKFLAKSNTTTIQPFFAFLLNRDRFYIQGFSALDVPVDPAQATLFYNDLGIGYYVYRDNESNALITAVAPTFEVHVNSPINHSGAYNRFDPFGTQDIVNLTSGLNTRFRQNSILTMGAVVPVTGPRPFSIEATVLLNIYFGRSARNPAAPIVGG
jgi:hypothetical protein